MATSKIVKDVKIDLYGFRGHRWVRVHGNWGKCFHAAVDDNFTLNMIRKCIPMWGDPNYCEDLYGYKLDCTDAKQIETSAWSPPLPYGDVELYSLVTAVLDLATALNLDTEVIKREYSVNDILTLMGNITTSATEQHRLLELLKGKDTHTLLKELDAANLRAQALTGELDKNAAARKNLGLKLKKDQERIGALEALIKALEQENARFLAERGDHKKMVLTKIQGALASM
jgi:hypothetical protein